MSKIILVILIILFAGVGIADTETCTISTSSTGNDIISVSGTTNAHAAEDPGTYNNVLSCPDPYVLDSGGTPAFNLSDTTNAHVQTPDGSYPVAVSISNGGTTFCYTIPGECPEIGIASISGQQGATVNSVTNAHIAEYNTYNTKICCGTLPPEPATGCILTLAETIIEETQTTQATAICYAEGEIETICPTLTFSSDATAIASVDATGLVTGNTAGSTNINAAGTGIGTCSTAITVETSTTLQTCPDDESPTEVVCNCFGSTLLPGETCFGGGAGTEDFILVKDLVIDPTEYIRNADPAQTVTLNFNVYLKEPHASPATTITVSAGGTTMNSNSVSLTEGDNLQEVTLNVDDLSGGLVTLVVNASPLSGENHLVNNSASRTITIVDAGDLPGGGTTATPEIPPIFIVFIALTVILLLARE